MTELGTGVDSMVGVEVASSVGGGVAVTAAVGVEVGARSASVGVGCDCPEGWKVTSWGGWKK